MSEDEVAVRELVSLGASLAMPRMVNGTPVAVVPEGYTLLEMKALRDVPQRADTHLKCLTVDALIAYVQRHSIEGTHTFVGDERVTSVIDYHSAVAPGWCKHIATFDVDGSHEYTKLIDGEAVPMEQLAFADWIEDMAHVVVDPDATSLIELAMNLQISENVTFKSRVRRMDGQKQIEYTQEDGPSGKIDLPDRVIFSVEVIKGMEPVCIAAFLRVRGLRAGNPRFTYRLPGLAKIKEEQRQELLKKIGAELGEESCFRCAY